MKAAAQFGFYQKAEWKPDDSMIAVAVSAPSFLANTPLLAVCSASMLPNSVLLGVVGQHVIQEFPHGAPCLVVTTFEIS